MEKKERKFFHRKKRDQPQDGTQASVQARLDDIWVKVRRHRRLVGGRRAVAMVILFVVLFGLALFLFFHTGSTYSTATAVQRSDAAGTQYLTFGRYFLKYSADGISCIDSRSRVRWNATYTMDTPIVDVCGTTAVVAEQEGTQVYVFDQNGAKGEFQTLYPIEQVCVAEQGVVAAVLEDGEISWVNFYDASGTLIAENRTTIDDSGYPMDIALSPDGLKIAVSFLRVSDGELSSRVVFYGFDSVGQAHLNNQVGEMECGSVMVPEIYYVDNSTAVAFRTDGFTIFSGRNTVKEKKTIQFDREILSVFYEDDRVGFVFDAGEYGYAYEMQIYNMSGNRVLQKYFDMEYDDISMQQGRVILYRGKEFVIYELNGQKFFEGRYEKNIETILDVRGLRKYMILTQDSADLVRLW